MKKANSAPRWKPFSENPDPPVLPKHKTRSKFYLRVKYQNGEYARYLMPTKEYAYDTLEGIREDMGKHTHTSFEYGTSEETAIISLEGILSITVVRDPDNRQIR